MTLTQELEKEGLTELNVRCQRVADKPEAYTARVWAEASELNLEWISLQVPLNSNWNKQHEIDEKKKLLRKRMAAFLAAILQPSPA